MTRFVGPTSVRLMKWLGLVTLLFVAACGPTGSQNSGGSGGNSGGSGGNSGGAGGSGGGGNPTCTQTPSCAGGGVVSGKVYAPNGMDPISGASIYVPTGNDEFPPGVSCDVCSTGSFQSCTQTFSGVDGSFRLIGVPAGTTEVDIQKGRFRRRLHLDVPCGELMLTADQSRLPRNSTEGDIPKIAVANGEWDKLECVLRKIGLDASAIDIFNHSDSFNESGKPDFSTLVQNFDMLKAYNIVFINCSDNTLESYLSNSAVVGNLKNYVGMGGRLYITDWSYDHIEQVPDWSSLVCWQPTGTCGGGAEPMHQAALGKDGIEVDATVEDAMMQQWLQQLGATNTNGTVHITHFLIDWVMQKSNVQPAVKEWVKGSVQSQDGSINGELPLTFTFDYNTCGRVLYSSYHTLGRDTDTCGTGGGLVPCQTNADCGGGTCQFGFCIGGGGGSSSCHFPDYCDSNPLSPQERILEYLIFEISTCVNPPG